MKTNTIMKLEYKTNKGVILFVTIPYDAINIRYNSFGLCYDCMVAPEPEHIPNRDWQLISSLKNTTEEQAYKMGFCNIDCFNKETKRILILPENRYWIILFESNLTK